MAAVVAAAAEAGRIGALGQVLRAGLAHDLRALVRYLPDAASLVLTLRLHGHELRDPELAEQLAGMMRAADLDPGRLLVRVGAADFPRLPGVAERAFAPLGQAGLRLALADVGAPGSGLDLITAPGIAALFLARSLIARLEPGARDEALVRAAIAGARALGLEVITPGVAKPELLAHLAELGVRSAYGDAAAPTLTFQRLLPWLGARFAEGAAA
jgi:EAL domain-containing protein (putative c-di-GMP-specific phosphodiesterase class I)